MRGAPMDCAEVATRVRARLQRAQAALNRLAAGDKSAEVEAMGELDALQDESAAIDAELAALEVEHGAAVNAAQKVLDDASACGFETLPAGELEAFREHEARFKAAAARAGDIAALAAHLNETTELYAARFARMARSRR